jgi:hypothetical protein
MSGPGPDLFRTYARQLRAHAHRLIAEGYARMNKAAFAREQEPVITGELVREMKVFQQLNEAPTWAVYYDIADDPPLNVANRLGKARPRVDIQFEPVVRGRRPSLRFEAKRLSSASGHTVTGYLGEEGLGSFLSGHYPTTHGEAGMLGYVQSEDEETWAGRIAAAWRRNDPQYGVADPPFAAQRVCTALTHTFISHHVLRGASSTVVIHHVLLGFAGK